MTAPLWQDPFPLAPDETPYRLLAKDLVSVGRFEDQEMLKVAPEALTLVAREALRDVSFLMRTKHLEQVAAILDDPEASDNDRAVALTLLRNAEESAHLVLPFCQDTGTATVFAKKGQRVWTGVRDEEYLTRGIRETFQKENLRYSQTVPLTLYQEKNSGTNLPAQIDILATDGMEYSFLFVAKGGGSANKSYLFQETKALLTPETLENFLVEKMRALGTAACPPYHLAFVIGGTSAETCMKTVKLATTGYLDTLPPQVRVGLGKRDKRRQPSEAGSVKAVRKGVVAARDLKAGHVIDRGDLMFARPATEFASGEIGRVIGARLKGPVKKGELIRRDNVALARPAKTRD